MNQQVKARIEHLETKEAFLFSAFLERHEVPFIWLLCVAACLRIAVFIAAFPLFNNVNVDEQAHYDLAGKYARGHIPVKIESRSSWATVSWVQKVRPLPPYPVPSY
jgi:hypothetical protein